MPTTRTMTLRPPRGSDATLGAGPFLVRSVSIDGGRRTDHHTGSALAAPVSGLRWSRAVRVLGWRSRRPGDETVPAFKQSEPSLRNSPAARREVETERCSWFSARQSQLTTASDSYRLPRAWRGASPWADASTAGPANAASAPKARRN